MAFTTSYIGLLSVQNSDSLIDLTGFRNLRSAQTIVLAFLGSSAVDLDGFNSLFECGQLIITRNLVSTVYISMPTLLFRIIYYLDISLILA